MAGETEISLHEKYILVSVKGGPLSPQEINVVITKAVEQANLSKLNILIHRELPVKQIASVIDFYKLGRLLMESSFRNKLALVFPEEMHNDNLDFFETTSTNHGINLKLFSKFDEALDWISTGSQF